MKLIDIVTYCKARLSEHSLTGLLLVTGLQLVLSVFYFASEPSEIKNAVFWGYSPVKLTIIIGIGLIGFLLLGLGLYLLFDRIGAFHSRVSSLLRSYKVLCFTLALGVTLLAIAMIPSENLGRWAYVHTALLPLLLISLLICFELVLFNRFANGVPESIVGLLRKRSKGTGVFLTITLAILGLLVVYMLITRAGVFRNSEHLWYESGVPLLWFQVAASILIGVSVSWISYKAQVKLDPAVMFVIIWLVSGLIWAKLPVKFGFWNPGPFPPTGEAFPFSDAEKWDLMSQFALIGEGLNGGQNTNRPAYPAYLTALHLIIGQDYRHLVTLQALLFAIFPAMVYWISAKLAGPAVGLSAAAMVIFRGINGVNAADLINLVNIQQLMPEFLLAVVVCGNLALLVRWLGQPEDHWLSGVLGCGVGLGIYLRPTILGIVPVVMLLMVFKLWRKKRALLINTLMLLVCMLMFLMPWELRNMRTDSTLYIPITIRKVLNVFEGRYDFEQHDQASREEEVTDDRRPQDTSADAPAEETAPQVDLGEGRAREADPIALITEALPQSFFGVVQNHFLHNLLTSSLIFPHSLSATGLEATIRAEDSVWRQDLLVALDIETIVILIFNGILVSIGIAYWISRDRISGMVPVLIFLAYHLSSALGRASGGRHLVPADWLLIPYYATGVHTVLFLGIRLLTQGDQSQYHENPMPTLRQQRGRRPLMLLVAVLISASAGVLVVAPDWIPAGAFAREQEEASLEMIAEYEGAEFQEYSYELISSRHAEWMSGRLLYPRFVSPKTLSDVQSFYFRIPTFDFGSFVLINERGRFNVIVPGNQLDQLTHGQIVSVIGCREDSVIIAAIVLASDPLQKGYIADPMPDNRCRHPYFVGPDR